MRLSRSLLAFLLSIVASSALAQQIGPPPSSPSGALNFTPAAVVNVMDPKYAGGARCDGVTNDTAAVNAAAAAVLAVTQGATQMIGPTDAAHPGCLVTQVNLTGFSAFGNSTNVIVGPLHLLCENTADAHTTSYGNVCVDKTQSFNIVTNFLHLTGLTSSPPFIGFQEGNQAPATKACCIGFNYNLQVDGAFKFAARYSAAAESVSDYGSITRNVGVSTGSIASLGTITPGSGGTPGTYTNVPLTGGTGQAANATVVVGAGGTVSSVTVTQGAKTDNQGFNYTVGDSLSATGAGVGNVTGFSVLVASVKQWTDVEDGSNHWNYANHSPWQTITWTPDTYFTFTQNNRFGGSIRYLGSNGVPLWSGYEHGAQYFHTYIQNTSTAPCIDLFDNGATGGTDGNYGDEFNIRCEATSVNWTFNMYGANATPQLVGFKYRDDENSASTGIINTDTNITNVIGYDFDLDLQGQYPAPIPVFSNAGIWTVTAPRIYVPDISMWNAPSNFSGNVFAKSLGNVQNMGPGDIVSGFAFGYSCSRKLIRSYLGPLCAVERASDSTSVDIYPKADGTFDQAAEAVFCANTTCTFKTAYGQTGSDNATQATLANQPGITFESGMNGRACMTFADQDTLDLVVTQSANVNGLFASGGLLSVVAHQNTNPIAADRIISKTTGSGGWELRYGATNFTSPEFVRYATTTNGDWQPTNSFSTGGHVFEIRYSESALSNLPTMGLDGTEIASFGRVSTQPVGTLADTNNMVIGNNSTPNRGYPGEVCEVIAWKTIPNATQMEAIRRNQGYFYNLSSVL